MITLVMNPTQISDNNDTNGSHIEVQGNHCGIQILYQIKRSLTKSYKRRVNRTQTDGPKPRRPNRQRRVST